METSPVETSPVETSPVETSPVETSPVETSPVETSPVETSPVETSPLATSPMETRPLETRRTPPVPVPGPEGAPAASCLTCDMDAEAAVLTADIAALRRMTPMSHQAYGPLVGVPRILALLERHALAATFFVPAYSAHRYPRVVRAIAEAGHEIAHHSYFHENTIGMDEKTEAASGTRVPLRLEPDGLRPSLRPRRRRVPQRRHPDRGAGVLGAR